ncbi:hypothetical protein OC846_001486 [Tilletia horrida]|uniref:RRM domain-containing protein n=1 Tax=Tilletia horrida TaxID=155126 RepID=A0AAN6GSK1_9BASI|nr:hypothetical protein OC846_001486 [Tilletia horrida]KAK0568822.1 hypothetical protein OC861_001515 [Tilletia horrida]
MSVSPGPSTRRNQSRSRSPWSRSPSSSRRPSPPRRETGRSHTGNGWGDEHAAGSAAARRDGSRTRDYADADAAQQSRRDRAGSGSRSGGGAGGWADPNRALPPHLSTARNGDGAQNPGRDQRRDRDYDEQDISGRRSRSPVPSRSRGERDSGWGRDEERRYGGHAFAPGGADRTSGPGPDRGWGSGRGGPHSQRDSAYSNGRFDDRDRDRRWGSGSRPALPPPPPRDPYTVSQREIDEAVDDGRAVLIEGLTCNTLKLHLDKIFTVYGDVRGIDMPIYKTSGQARGTAVLVYTSSRAAAKAASHMNTGLIDGQTVAVKVADLRREDDTYMPSRR